MLAGPLVFVDVDTRRDFLEPTGALYVPDSAAILDNLARLTWFAWEKGVPVVATACTHSPGDAELDRFGPHCMAGTPGRERAAVTAWPGEGGRVLGPSATFTGGVAAHLTLEKRELDVFSHPEADRVIAVYDRDLGGPTFVVYGVATEYCVRAAVLGLLDRGCKVAVVADAVRAIDRDREPEVFAGFSSPGALLTLTEVVCDDGMPSMHDKFKKRYQAPKAGERVRRQIAVEAARRMWEAVGPDPDDPSGRLKDAAEADYYTAKRKAAAVLGHRVRPGDLPSDAEVREQLIGLARSRTGQPPTDEADPPEPEGEGGLAAMSDHLDRFAIYRMRLLPLESVKQNAKWHPEGDALYHSLQVFEAARAVRPYDEEFLLAALLHDVGKAVAPSDHVAAGVEALPSQVTERTLWLVEHHMDLLAGRDRAPSPKLMRTLEASESFEDLKLLRDLDDAGRVPGAVVGTVDEALAYLKGLECESYLGETPPA